MFLRLLHCISIIAFVLLGVALVEVVPWKVRFTIIMLYLLHFSQFECQVLVAFTLQ